MAEAMFLLNISESQKQKEMQNAAAYSSLNAQFGPGASLKDDVIRQTREYLERFTKLKNDNDVEVSKTMRQISTKHKIKKELMIHI